MHSVVAGWFSVPAINSWVITDRNPEGVRIFEYIFIFSTRLLNIFLHSAIHPNHPLATCPLGHILVEWMESIIMSLPFSLSAQLSQPVAAAAWMPSRHAQKLFYENVMIRVTSSILLATSGRQTVWLAVHLVKEMDWDWGLPAFPILYWSLRTSLTEYIDPTLLLQ